MSLFSLLGAKYRPRCWRKAVKVPARPGLSSWARTGASGSKRRIDAVSNVAPAVAELEVNPVRSSCVGGVWTECPRRPFRVGTCELTLELHLSPPPPPPEKTPATARAGCAPGREGTCKGPGAGRSCRFEQKHETWPLWAVV
ncbi:hypothetical protein HJG60_011077 [Phyllostomus discolor]|uniref:Uncharacterized protein n=1 Tax=Phyllostomus discolor TaxID=89673 RepID=A0A834EAH1_9CHIR|nr:hypothetical protein HJG60_011077 [Phyllostomus discolor]